MRRIVLYISLIFSLFGCSDDRVYVEAEYCSIASLWSYARQASVPITDNIYLQGSVVANDRFGEINRAIVVSDASGGVVLELDMDDIAKHYPLHSRVQIRCAGLWLGTVGPKLILGAKPEGDYVVDRLPASRALNIITPLPENNDTPTIRHRKITELEYRDVLSCVEVEGINVVEAEYDAKWADRDPITNRPITTVRHFVQGSDTLRVVVDAESLYATEPIPIAKLSLLGILDWFEKDIALRITGYSVTVTD